MERCKHGSIRNQCYYCRDRSLTREPFELQLFFYRPRDCDSLAIGLTLVRYGDSKKVSVFLYNRLETYQGSCYLVIDESEIDTESISALSPNQVRVCRESLRNLALTEGLLFEPQHPLTWREQGFEGPSHCSHCQEVVSFERGSLGCQQCGYYICPDGYCLCGEGWLTNYLDQKMLPKPELKCDWKIRRAAVRIATNISNTGVVVFRDINQ
jgi:hypothetical protein